MHTRESHQAPLPRYSSYKNMPSWEDMAERVYFRRTPAMAASIRRQRPRATSKRTWPDNNGPWVPAGKNDLNRVNGTSSSTSHNSSNYQNRQVSGKSVESSPSTMKHSNLHTSGQSIELPCSSNLRQISPQISRPGFCQADILRRKVSNSPERITGRIAWSNCIDLPLASRAHDEGESTSKDKSWHPTDRVFEKAAEEAQKTLQAAPPICQDDAVTFQSHVLEAQYRRLSG